THLLECLHELLALCLWQSLYRLLLHHIRILQSSSAQYTLSPRQPSPGRCSQSAQSDRGRDRSQLSSPPRPLGRHPLRRELSIQTSQLTCESTSYLTCELTHLLTHSLVNSLSYELTCELTHLSTHL